MNSKEERDARLAELRGILGGSFFVTIAVEANGEEFTFHVYIDYGTPYVSLSSPGVVQLMEDSDPRLVDMLEHVREEAFDYELEKREQDLIERNERMRVWRLEQQSKKRARPGHVYLLQSEMGQYKIGRTIRIGKRFPDFNTFLPFNVTLRHSFRAADHIAAERYLHEKFADKRGRGEWFDLTPDDVAWICGLTDGALDEQ